MDRPLQNQTTSCAGFVAAARILGGQLSAAVATELNHPYNLV
jgi:hypothetical protein